MLKSLMSSSKFVETANLTQSWIGTSGVVRFNSANQSFEVLNTHGAWDTLAQNDGSVGLTQEAVQAIEWAAKQQRREYELEMLATKHPSIQDALNTYKLAKEQLNIIATLIEKHE